MAAADDSLTLEESFVRLNTSVDRMIADRVKDAQLLNRIAMVLEAFFKAPVSIASLQPVLDLAVEMNPELALDQRPLGPVLVPGPASVQ
jgi:hypothetical protein